MAHCQRSLWGAISCFVMAVCASLTAEAQDFRVYTTVKNVAVTTPSTPVVARSLTLFHAGKVYDYMDGPGELVIYEPIHDRFILMHGYLGSIVPMSELRQRIDDARHAGVRLADELASATAPEAGSLLRMLSFQMAPVFQESWEPGDRQLSLSGAEFGYSVRTVPPASPTSLEQYLTYTDWAAKLNSVLHSHAMYPDARLQLNDALRSRQRLPVVVILKGRAGTNLNLQAEHEFGEQLQAIDRDMIHQWERTRESGKMNWVTFREYQEQITQRERPRR